jgi:zona occludens toxin (predicted ATPase)
MRNNDHKNIAMIYEDTEGPEGFHDRGEELSFLGTDEAEEIYDRLYGAAYDEILSTLEHINTSPSELKHTLAWAKHRAKTEDVITTCVEEFISDRGYN